jgi:hypothetical protein
VRRDELDLSLGPNVGLPESVGVLELFLVDVVTRA